MTAFWQQILNGLMLGGVYALFAVGLTLSLGVLRVLNNAHGITLALAAIVAIKIATVIHVSFALALLIGAATGFAIGVILELLAFRPLRTGAAERNIEMPSMVSSLAMLFILQTIALKWTDAQAVSFPSSIYHGGSIDVGPFLGRSILLITFVMALVLVSACWWVVNRTQIGRAIRAIAMDEEAAGMMGINASRLKLLTMATSSALAGVAGILTGVALGAVDFTLGQSELLKGFAVVILGGIGSIPGALIGGLVLGVAEGGTVHVVGSSWQPAAAFVVLIAVLIARPQGIFGRPSVDRA